MMQVTYRTMSLRRLVDIGSSARMLRDVVLSKQLIDTILYGMKPILEYAFGMCVGYVLGWFFGLYIGQVYVEYYAPAYLVDLGQLPYWRMLPYGFARGGAITAGLIGVVVVIVINSRLLNERIVSLSKSGTTNPRDIAHILHRSEESIDRRVDGRLRSVQ